MTKLSTERIRDLLNDSLSHSIQTQDDTTYDVDLLLNELLLLRELAGEMAEALRLCYDVTSYPGNGDSIQDYALAAYRAEYPEKGETMALMNLNLNMPYIMEEMEEGIEKRMATAVGEFESYVAFSLQAKGLSYLASEAPRLQSTEEQKALSEESLTLSPEAQKEYDEGKF